MDFTSSDAAIFVETLNYGQKCLLQGLVKLLNKSNPISEIDEEGSKVSNTGHSNPYTSGSSSAASLATNTSSTIKDKIGKLFNLGGVRNTKHVFKPAHQIQLSQGKRQVLSRSKGKGPLKKKVKQMKLNLVALPTMLRRTPTGAFRSKLTQTIWINKDASEEETQKKIVEQLGCKSVSYLYAQGKNLRKAELSDVENADSWDMETLRALMGNGSLYVVKNPTETSVSDYDSDSTLDQDVLSESDVATHVKPEVSALHALCIIRKYVKSHYNKPQGTPNILCCIRNLLQSVEVS